MNTKHRALLALYYSAGQRRDQESIGFGIGGDEGEEWLDTF